MSFDDLVRAADDPRCRISDVVAWIAQAERSGVIEATAYATDRDGRPIGARRYVITDRGRRLPPRRSPALAA